MIHAIILLVLAVPQVIQDMPINNAPLYFKSGVVELRSEMDVPAIQVIETIPEDERPTCRPMTCPTAKSCFIPSVCYPPETERTVTTCADKSRIKLQSEDGQWHCVRFK